MRKIVFLASLCVVSTLMAGSAMAQTLTLHSLGATPASHSQAPPKTPSYCNPCLFYGGGWNNTSADWILFDDYDGGQDQTLIQMFSAFRVPKGETWTVTALFANIAYLGIDHFTPMTPEWSINKGMSAGNGGTVIASGKTKGTQKATGRTAKSAIGDVVEYTVKVKLPKAVKLKPGLYYESVVVPCDATQDPLCDQGAKGAAFMLTDTFDNSETKQGANHVGHKEPKALNFINAPAFAINDQAVDEAYCTTNGYKAVACDWMSDGVVGIKQ
jgi:hypothetical protein